jgi:Fe-S oxidoreductase
MMLKKEYPELLKTASARLIAERSRDAAEFLVALKKAGKLALDFKEDAGAGTVAYQPACHLKNQSMGLKSKELLELLPKTSVSVVDRCSGHDGTWSMKEEYYELSMKYAKKLFDGIEQAGADTVSTDCPLAALQIAQGTGRAPVHPIQLVAQAYGIDSDHA